MPVVGVGIRGDAPVTLSLAPILWIAVSFGFLALAVDGFFRVLRASRTERTGSGWAFPLLAVVGYAATFLRGATEFL